MPTGPSRGFASIILRGDVLVEVITDLLIFLCTGFISPARLDWQTYYPFATMQVDGVAIQHLEHAEIGRLIIGPPGVNLLRGTLTRRDLCCRHQLVEAQCRPANFADTIVEGS